MIGADAGSARTVARTLRLCWSVADRPARAAWILGMVTVLLSTLLTSLAPVALAVLIDTIVPRSTTSGHWTWVGLVLVYAGCLGSARILAELRAVIYGRAQQRLYRKLGVRVFTHLMHLPLRYHHETPLGEINQTVVNGLIGQRMMVFHIGYTLVPLLIETSIVGLVLARLHSAALVALFLCTATLYAAAFTRGIQAMQGPARQITATSVEANGVLTDSIVNYEAVKSFNAEAEMRERYQRLLLEHEAKWTQWYQQRVILGLTVGCIFTSSVTLSLAWAAHSVTLGTVSVGEFALVNAYMLRLAAPLELLGAAIRDMSEGAAYMNKLLDLLDTDVEPGSGTHAVGPQFNGTLEFRGVSFGYRSDRSVLNDISFTVPAGSTIAIVGPTGAGKSSLAKLLLRLYEPTSGNIFLDGVDIATLSPHALRAAISIVPQDTVLLNDTIAKNIALGTPCGRRDIEAAAQIAGMDSIIRNWPDGYATVVGERGLKLSGGERQRIAIARAILRNPHVLVFDEATSSLDAHTERAILRNLRQRTRHMTTLVIAHRLSAVVDATAIFVFADGSLVEHGSHAALLIQDGWYASLWRAQRNTPASA